MKIVEYKLHPSPIGMKCPDFIDDGGYWGNPDDHTMIGLISSNVEYYVPDTIVELTAAELETRQLAIHAKYPMHKINPVTNEESTMTTTDVETAISDWITSKE